jgi:SAM-dependent methyltransferase
MEKLVHLVGRVPEEARNRIHFIQRRYCGTGRNVIKKFCRYIRDKENHHRYYCIRCESLQNARIYGTNSFNELTYLECSKCGLIFKERHPENEFDYSRYNVDFMKPWLFAETGELLFRKVEMVLKRYAAFTRFSRFKVLDIGCGSGDLLHCIKSRYPNALVTGIDPSVPMCRQARKRYGLNVIEGKLGEIVLPEGSYDLILMFGNVMLHRNPIQSFKLIHSILAKGGILIFDNKNPLCLIRKMSKWLPSTHMRLPNCIVKKIHRTSYHGMHYGFTKKFLDRLLNELGLDVLSVTNGSPRNLLLENRVGYGQGLSGILLRLMNVFDKMRGEQAWIETACRKT